SRSDRVPPGRPPRDLFDQLAAELGVGPFDLYVRPAAAGAGAPAAAPSLPLLAIEPGDPPAIIIDAALTRLGPAPLRFAAARALRMVAVRFDGALAGADAELAALLGAVVRQYVPDFRPADVPDDALAAQIARVNRQLPRKLRGELMPYALEISGGFD